MNDHPSPKLFALLTQDELERLEFLREQFRVAATNSFLTLPRMLTFATILAGTVLPALLVLLWTDHVIPARQVLVGLLLLCSIQIMLVWWYGRASFGGSNRVQRAARCYSDYVLCLVRKYEAGN